jgi:ABC-type branched-subunit amino acid transport system ATPase component/MFS family permease
MTGSDELTRVRAAEAALEALEDEPAALRDECLAALGFGSGGPVPAFRDGLRASGTPASTLVGVSLVTVPLFFLQVVFLTFDRAIASTLGIDPLGFEFPGLLNSLVIPVFVVAVGAAALSSAWWVFRRRGGRKALMIAAAVACAAGLWTASFATGEGGLLLAGALSGAAVGAAVTAGASLLMDAYPPGVRVRVISVWVLALALGNLVAALIVLVGDDVWSLTWRGVSMTMAVVAMLLAPGALLVRDRGVGCHDLARIQELVQARVGARGTVEAELSDADVAIGFWEQMRQLFVTRSAIAMIVVFLLFGTVAVSLHAFIQQFIVARYSWSFDDRAELFVVLAAVALLPMAGLVAQGDAWFRGDAARLMRMATGLAFLSAASLAVVAIVASEVVTIIGLSLTSLSTFFALAIAFVVMLSVVDPRLRPHAAAVAIVFVAVAALVGGILAGQFSDRYGVTAALVFFAANFLGVGTAMRSARTAMAGNLDALVLRETEREELRVRVSSGQHFPLLGCRNVDFSYGKLQILFGVDFTVDDGELVALLGTNGAGKSTLLKVISGIGVPSRGTVHFRGADITNVDPVRRVEYGITQMPGGRAVFGDMSVVDNLRMYGFTLRRSKQAIDRGIDATFDAFPALAGRRNQPGATLSGGEQQMLSLGKAFILQPRLLLIDELSLGLAPLIVGNLVEMVRRINATGTAVVVVEQSVNIALSLVDHAYFMERGEMRFDGVAKDLVDRPDLLRSVFLEGASKGLQAMAAADRQDPEIRPR